MSGLHIGIAGAGLLGRLLAWTLAHHGHRVSVFDPAPGPQPLFDGQGAAGFTAAGMLSPLAELETAEADIAARGWVSIACWAGITSALAERGHAVPFARRGSLMVAHGADLGAARRVLAHLASKPLRDEGGNPSGHQAPSPQVLDSALLRSLEPSLHGANGPLHAWLLPGEAHIDTVRALQALHDDAPGVAWHWDQPVHTVEAHTLGLANGQARRADLAIDVRGIGARPALPVRGVRGETVWLHAPGLGLQRPVRLLHPRHRVYIVPRRGDTVLVGASEIESEDRSPVSLRSAVELMAAAHSVMPALAEARILRMDRNLRPALPDHRPRIDMAPGLLRINGLYRHGWLLAPSLVDDALTQLKLGRLPTHALPGIAAAMP
ncbi:FAD-dependent oxidoreductase [Aquabacterium soli]|uniref:FAD-dependent oxidoreductase n=1 Tax=Aquabacterium soli TaxID=2493092 RepID=UPI0018F5B3CF|nr:FAD-dependent oxidoreductase [Aquabacterium soli]